MIHDLPSQQYLQECFNYDSKSGDLIWRIRPLHHFQSNASMKATNSKLSGKIAGNASAGYKKSKLNNTGFAIHNLVWKYHTGLNPIGFIDHIDGDSLNNKIENLRDVDRSVNQHNRKIPVHNNSGAKGISWNKASQKWKATLNVKCNSINLGYFKNKEDAIKARQDAEKQDWSHLDDKGLSRERFIFNLDYLKECVRYEDGSLYWLERPEYHFKSVQSHKSWNAKYAGTKLTAKNESGYVITTINYSAHRVHRLIYWLCSGIEPPKDMLIDHKNGVRDDNRYENLRLVSYAENARNTKKNITSNSGFKGVCFSNDKGRWKAEIQFNNKKKHLGYFETPELAHEAYKIASTELYGEFANHG